MVVTLNRMQMLRRKCGAMAHTRFRSGAKIPTFPAPRPFYHPAHNGLVLLVGWRRGRPTRRSARDLYMRIDLEREGYNAADKGAAT